MTLIPSLYASGTQLLAVNTAFVTTISAYGTFIWQFSLENETTSDTIIYTVSLITLDSGNSEQLSTATVSNTPTNPCVILGPYATDLASSIALSIEQTAGTGRHVPWKILQI